MDKFLKTILLSGLALSFSVFTYGGEKSYIIGGKPVSVNDPYIAGSMLASLPAPVINNSWSAMCKMPFQGISAMLQGLRSQYEGKVKQLAGDIPYLQEMAKRELSRNQFEVSADSVNELVANILHDKRRAIGYEFKNMTPEFLQSSIYQRNIKKYNDPYGPTIAYLRAQGKTWDAITKSATSPNGGDLSWLNLGKWFK